MSRKNQLKWWVDFLLVNDDSNLVCDRIVDKPD